MPANRLADQTSPYLRQHADNPVDWYPWGEEAFETARTRDVPILLSIGYSACHWCHVMAHESFEDQATASVMNRLFVNVKVDREERPDIDSVYMEALQAISGGGGWPMTVFLFPDGRPFFAGTYFPRARFVELMHRVTAAWTERRPGLDSDAESLVEAVRAGTALPGAALGGVARHSSENAGLLDEAADALLARFDGEWGGFGRAPKFPQPTMIELLLQAATLLGRRDALDAAATTLDAMASGGIYDHLGGGFARYSTDRQWLVPHFEKMLYDNALLARTYLHAWQITGTPGWRQVVEETVGYLLSPPMRLEQAGIASAEDADSEGVEGRWYVWTLDEVRDVGGDEAVDWFGVTEEGNWEGRNILWRPQRGQLLRTPVVEAARRAMAARRASRVRPGLDDKVLTEWNAMAVATLAEAGAALGEPAWTAAAEDIGDFLLSSLRRPDGRWLRSWQSGFGPGSSAAGRRPLAVAADYAWLVEAFSRLAEATGRARWVSEANSVADDLLELFWDDDQGGFQTTGADAERLIARPKDTQDGAIPAANSVAAAALLRLGALTGRSRLRDHALAVIEIIGPALRRAPVAFSGLVTAADLAARGLTEVAITGDRPDLVAAVQQRYRPDTVLAWGEPYPSPLWDGRTGPDTVGLAFVCRDWTCQAPVDDVGRLLDQLAGIPAS
jgi:uncharacterized protein YyaL (SSP411 family)